MAHIVSAAGRATTVATGGSQLGRILVDGQGRTLYLFEKDANGHSSCTGACATYWPPLHGHLRRLGFGQAQAGDLTQAFFARLLEKRLLDVADARRGRFRTFLLTALRRFIINEWKRETAGKRGGGTAHVSLNMQDPETSVDLLALVKRWHGEGRTVLAALHDMELVRDHFRVRRADTMLVFPGKSGRTPVRLHTAWETAVRRADLTDFTFHDLRHTFASYLAMQGASLREIADALGHKTLAMVMRYSHLTEAHTRSVVERMNRAVSGSQTSPIRARSVPYSWAIRRQPR